MTTRLDRKKVREKLTVKAEEMKQLRALALRAAKILRHLGYSHRANIWKHFDLLMYYEIRTTDIRHEVLKRVFSVRGARIVLDDERWIEIIERKVLPL
jgi:hypothetical protein